MYSSVGSGRPCVDSQPVVPAQSCSIMSQPAFFVKRIPNHCPYPRLGYGEVGGSPLVRAGAPWWRAARTLPHLLRDSTIKKRTLQGSSNIVPVNLPTISVDNDSIRERRNDRRPRTVFYKSANPDLFGKNQRGPGELGHDNRIDRVPSMTHCRTHIIIPFSFNCSRWDIAVPLAHSAAATAPLPAWLPRPKVDSNAPNRRRRVRRAHRSRRLATTINSRFSFGLFGTKNRRKHRLRAAEVPSKRSAVSNNTPDRQWHCGSVKPSAPLPIKQITVLTRSTSGGYRVVGLNNTVHLLQKREKKKQRYPQGSTTFGLGANQAF